MRGIAPHAFFLRDGRRGGFGFFFSEKVLEKRFGKRTFFVSRFFRYGLFWNATFANFETETTVARPARVKNGWKTP